MKKHKLLATLLAFCMTLTGFGTIHASAGGTRVSVHDPSIIKDGQTYYVFGSHIDAAKSADLMNWKTFTNGYTTPGNVEFGDLSKNLSKAFAWAGENLGDCKGGFSVWAPDVIYNPQFDNGDGTTGAYVMYFCTSSDYRTSVICFATSKSIEGPYTFRDTLIYSGFSDTDVMWEGTNRSRRYSNTNIDELIASGEVTFNNGWFNQHLFNNQMYPNAIDPTIYYDTDGKMYMTYGSWSGGIFTLEVNPRTGYVIHPKTGTTSDGRMVDSYFGTKIAGGYGKSGEGPFMEYNADTGYYYLWTVYGGLFSDGGYNMRVSRSRSPMGPFTDPAGNPAVLTANSNLDAVGLKVMGNYKFSCLDRAYMACGHNSVLRDDDGQWYLFYHARFDDNSEYHEVRVHSMWFNEDGWPVVAPFEYAGDTLSESGYSESDIVGEYEFINHGNATDGKIINYQKITLNADGTISGAVKGKWEQSPATAEATLTLDGKTYTGYFLAAKNEKGTKVMSFTAVGSNNQTVWGAKNEAYTGTPRSAVSDYTDRENVLVYNWDSVGEPGETIRVGDTDLLSGVSYYIVNKNSGMSLDLPNGKLDEGTNIQQWDFNGLFAQQFRIIADKDGWCRIASVGDESKVISVASAVGADGANVELQTYTGADHQRFRIVKNGIYYAFLSKCSGAKSALDVFEWSKENGANIAQYPYNEFDCQLFKVKPVYPALNPGSYRMRNIETGEENFVKVVSMADSTADPNAVTAELMRCNKDGSYSMTETETDASFVFEPVATLPEPQKIKGDVDANGQFELIDIVAMTKYLHGKGTLADADMGDMNEDGTLDVFDLALMKRQYSQK
ncbi:MAG: family 43 glycosylhydrolase [Oscillospiraceae bacterium]|nr:family 43 glycosylhydrolase [Oscillospiraceae bacterium]